MKTSKKIEKFVVKLRSLPEKQKKVIFFIVMAIIVLIIGFFGIILTKKNIENVGDSLKSISIPSATIPEKDFGMTDSLANDSNVEETEESLENVSASNNQILNTEQ